MPPLHILFLGAAWGRWATDALLEGLRAARPDAVVLDVSDSKVCPAIPPAPCLAVCFGLRQPYEEWVKVFSAVGLHTVVLDNGYLGRVPYGVDPEGPEKDTYFYALNVDRILDPVRTHILLYPYSQDKARIERFEHLLQPMNYDRYGRPSLVVLGQTPDDRSHGKSAAWLAAYYTAQLIGFEWSLPDRGLVCFFRPHPHAPEELTKAVVENCDNITLLPSDEPLLPQLQRLSRGRGLRVYALTSNAGLEALLAGFVVSAPGAWYVGLAPVSALETAVHAQFTLPELRSPELANRLIDGLAFISDGCKP